MKKLLLLGGLCLLFKTVNGQISVSQTTTNISCFGACDASISLTPSGGNAPYSFAWSGAGAGMSGSVLNSLCPGTYTCTITDASSSGTVTIYSEDFNAGAPSWTQNTVTGPQGADPNFFTIADDEGGVAVGGCGVANNGDATLHITSMFFPGGGAAYDAGGLCGVLFCPETSTRANSGNISTIGHTNLTLSFDYIAGGQAGIDQATVWYNSGNGWTQIGTPLLSPTCPTGQGLWSLMNIALPASCENIPNLQVGIQWVNNDDGVGTDPSVAINNLRITKPTAAGNTPVVVNITVTEPDLIILNNTITTGTSCNLANGSFEVSSILGGTAPYTYSLDNGVTAQLSPLFSDLASGAYTILVEDDNGCTVTQNFNVNASTGPVIAQVNTVNPSCGLSNGSIEIVGFGGAGGYEYSSDNGVSFQNDALFSNLFSGTYDIVLQDASGCQANGIVNLTNANGPVVNAGIDQTICSGQNVTLSGTSSTAGLTYTWDNGVIDGQVFAPLTTTTYTLTGTDASGCSSTDQVTVTVEVPPVISITPSVISGCSPLNVNFLNETNGADLCSWSFSNGLNSSNCGNQTFTFTGNNCISLVYTASTNSGCSVSQTYTDIVCVNAEPNASFYASPFVLTTSNSTATMVNNSTNASTFLWYFSDGGFSNAEEPVHTFNIESGVNQSIMLVASNAAGCNDTAEVNIQFVNQIVFYIPNAFTPNGDPFNNVFNGLFTEGFDEAQFYFVIYNRWGEIIWESNDHRQSWDGTYQGKNCPDGEYVWHLELKSPQNDFREEYMGHFNLLR